MGKSFERIAQESAVKWKKGMRQLNNAFGKQPETGLMPTPNIRTFEEPLTMCENCNGNEFVTISSCVKCEHSYARAENHNMEVVQLRDALKRANDLLACYGEEEVK
jgi:hypothetical protein